MPKQRDFRFKFCFILVEKLKKGEIERKKEKKAEKSKKRQKRVLTERVEGDIVIKLSQRDGAAGEQS